MKTDPTESRVFENDFLEKYSKTNAYVVIIAYVVLSAGIFIYYSFRTAVSIPVQFALLFSGLFVFSFTEYMVHRYLFHSHNASDKKNMTYRLHHIHHDHPRDKERLALPLPVGLAVAGVVYLLFWLAMGTYTPFFFPGFLTGYALYLFVHYLIHTRRPPKNLFRVLWKNHSIHHYQDDTKAYGVTSPLWDVIFRTTP